MRIIYIIIFGFFSFQMSAQITGTVVKASMIDCADGSIIIEVAGGYPPYTYNWTGPDNFNSNQKNISNLKAGLYSLEVKDAMCGKTYTGFEVNAKYDPGIVDYKNLTDCLPNWDSGDGVINLGDLKGSDLTGFTFSWIGPDGFVSTSKNISMLKAGQYSVTITSPSGCTKKIEKYLCCCEFEDPPHPGTLPSAKQKCYTQGSSLPILIKETVIPFNSATNTSASIVIDISDGNPKGTPIITWSGPNGFSSFEKDIFNLMAGTYCVTVTNGCATESRCFEIEDCAGHNIVIGGDLTNVCTPYKGNITNTISGGKVPYSFNWSNNQTAQNISNLQPGNYCITVTDKNYCFATKCFEITSGTGTHDQNCKFLCDNKPIDDLGPPTPFMNTLNCDYVDYKCNDGYKISSQYTGTYIEFDDYGCTAYKRNKLTNEICNVYQGDFVYQYEYINTLSGCCGGSIIIYEYKYCVIQQLGYYKLLSKDNIVIESPINCSNGVPGYAYIAWSFNFGGPLLVGQCCVCAEPAPINPELTLKNSQKDNKNIFLFPNPASNKLTIFLPERKGEFEYKISDMSGQIQESGQQEVDNKYEISFDVASLADGMYTVTLVSPENELINLKFIKQ